MWEPATLPFGQNAIDRNLIFTFKDSGEKKAGLVAKGFQQPSTYGELGLTYVHVCRLSKLRILLSKAVNNDWPIKQIEGPTAFLHGTLIEDIFIKEQESVKENVETGKLKRLGTAWT